MNRDLMLITGVSSGVGLSLARHLASRYRVIGVARQLEVAREALRDADVTALYHADLSQPGSLASCLDQVITDHGVPLNLINNAGVNLPGRLEEIIPADLATSLQVNFLTPVTIMQRFLPAMVKDGFGRIINITSGAPLNCFSGYTSYSASKGALNAATVTAARECENGNIRINLMSPGPVRSNMAPDAPMDPSACHPTVDYLLTPEEGGPTGGFFWLGRQIPLFPDLDGIRWLEGEAPERFRRVV